MRISEIIAAMSVSTLATAESKAMSLGICLDSLIEREMKAHFARLDLSTINAGTGLSVQDVVSQMAAEWEAEEDSVF